jgi:hypothetical protein
MDRSNESTRAGIFWPIFHENRRCFGFWPSVWSMRTVQKPFHDFQQRKIEVNSVHDFGATTRPWEAMVLNYWPMAEYQSYDIDRSHQHDY